MRRLSLSFSATALAAVALCAQSASAQCQGPFTGGAIPAVGTGGGGVFPGTLPPNPGVFTGTVTAPGAGQVLTSVKLNGLSHTWGGDVTMFLESPANPGTLHTVFSGGAADPNIDWINNSYEIVDPLETCRVPLPMGAGVGAANGIYAQNFNGFAGPANTANTALQSIPVGAGTWSLYAYDFVGGDVGTLTSWELCFGAAGTSCPPPPPPCGVCVTGGAGSAIPGTGAADGVWPTTLPLGPMVSTASITTPAGATALQSVKLLGLSHTWRSDVMVVLTAPNGSQHIIYAEDNTVNCGGCDDIYGGDYAFTDGAACPPANGTVPLCGVGVVPSGEYQQDFGGWPNGNAGLNTTPISAIPIAAGTNTWTLTIYDWCTGFDNGSLVGFDLCFEAATAPIAYCTAGTTTNGCNASISANVNPNVANNAGVTIAVANVEGQKQGIYFYGIDNTGFSPVPWSPGSTSFLCVKGPTQRAGSQGAGGTTNACDGAFSLNWDLFVTNNPIAVGVPFSAGDSIFVQAWFRDPPAPKTTNLSNAIEMTVQP
ncbi:MAG: hypothetical protein JNN27_09465 [Planctomycetes bacterium]|nr:hypothetical protein [Planctomycetota bacterium]